METELTLVLFFQNRLLAQPGRLVHSAYPEAILGLNNLSLANSFLDGKHALPGPLTYHQA